MPCRIPGHRLTVIVDNQGKGKGKVDAGRDAGRRPDATIPGVNEVGFELHGCIALSTISWFSLQLSAAGYLHQRETPMRLAFFLATLMAPVAATAGSQCVLPTDPASAALPREAGVASVSVPKQTGLHAISSDQIERSSALRRITAQGAEAFDIGTSHGLRGIFARKGDTFQVFYITPDNQAVVGGVMWESTGHNVTRDQVAPIDGAIPTVTIGDVPTAAPQAQQANTGEQADSASALRSIVAGKFGTDTAPTLTMFIDPLCSYSVRAMDQLQSYVANGRVQLAVVPISVLDYEDHGRSTLAAKAMLSLPPSEMVYAWTSNKLTDAAGPTSAANLATNMRAAEAIGLRGTPTFLWKTASGKEGRADGLPGNLEAVIAALGK